MEGSYQAGGAMKLHLGCGKRHFDGYLNCDLRDSDMDMDIRKLPFPDDSADEIIAIHVCEHFYRHEIASVLNEWRRVLNTSGTLIVELPCLDRVLGHFMAGSPVNMTMWPLYGDPSTHKDGEPSLHKWCWSKNEFMSLLESVGFKEITEEKPHFHQPSRDMRWVCQK